MKWTGILLSAALLSGLMLGQARAECQIADAKLEEAILHHQRPPRLTVNLLTFRHGPGGYTNERDYKQQR